MSDKPIVMRLSPPDSDDTREWEVVGYHQGRYPIYAEQVDEHTGVAEDEE